MAYLSDIEIAQSVNARPILEVASDIGIDEKYLEPYGKNKAKALAAAIKGPVTPQCPASILQFHPNAIIVADEDALSEL